ncbi:MAG: hypothetical protein H8E55_71305 [Pelagibacterales bacterium]|nr:hypothetical protein [Pelagibacterales bacterium]
MNKLVVIIVAVLCLYAYKVNAEENIVVAKVNGVVTTTQTWFANEKADTIEFQKVKWQEGKDQVANSILKIKKLFNWGNN